MRLPHGIRRLFRLDTVLSTRADEVEEEFQHHFDEVIRSLVATGLSQSEARRAAQERFGDVDAYREALMKIDGSRRRSSRRHERLSSLRRALSQGMRSLARTPGFTTAVVVILALGIGANAVMFGVVDRLLLSPPQHIVDADDVRRIHVRRVIFNGETSVSGTMTWPDYQDFRGLSAFADIGAYTTPTTSTVSWGDQVEPASTASGSASFFRLLGVQPTMGRFFHDPDDAIGAGPTVVLSHEYWERRFASDPDVLGRTVDIGGHAFSVIGVSPAGFTGVELQSVDLWLPIETAQALANGDEWVGLRGWYWLHSVVRLAPGSSLETAQAQATAAHRAGRGELIDQDRYDPEASVLVSPLIAARGPQPAQEAQVARWLGGVSLIVLLIACFNVTNLLLARAVRTRREVAVRLALGVGRGTLFAERLLESMLLAGLGATAAVGVARILGQTIHRALIPNVAFTDSGLGPRLFWFTLAATVLSGVVTGVIPALQATRTDLVSTLRASGRGSAAGGFRLRRALLVGQAALSVILLVGAGLFVRSLRQAEQLDLGFETDRLIVMDLEWSDSPTQELRQSIYDEVLVRVRRLPGVRSAGLTYTVPFRSSISLGQPRVPGLDSVPRHHDGGPYVNKVGSGFFDAMGLAVVAGRGIEPPDDAAGAPPVTVLSQSMALAFWPGGDALGSCLIIGGEESPCTEVVGIVENHRRQALVEDDPHFQYYLNQGHPGFVGPPQAMMIGALDDPGSVIESIRAEARAASSRIRFVNASPMHDYVEPELRSWRLGASMFSLFGVLALIVAAWGLYSVLAFDVALRRHELGVRSALGAGGSRIIRMVLRQAVGTVAVGTMLGLALAGFAARFVEPLLFRVDGTDPPTYALVTAVLLGVAVLAGCLPAVRATRVDPTEALRSD